MFKDHWIASDDSTARFSINTLEVEYKFCLHSYEIPKILHFNFKKPMPLPISSLKFIFAFLLVSLIIILRLF